MSQPLEMAPEEAVVIEPKEEVPALEETLVEESLPVEETPSSPAPDYAKMAEEDLAAIRANVPGMGRLRSLTDLPQYERFAVLREAGLTPEEAFWATSHSLIKPPAYDNRSHLRSSAPRPASGSPYAMTAEELSAARDLFGDLTDAEIRTLYAKCRS